MPKFDISKFAEGLSVPESGTLMEITLGKIVPNPRNFYPAPQGAELDELIASILANGLLEPLTVVPAEGGKYRLISGHSRLVALGYAAQTDARLYRVPCRVLEGLSEAQEECALIEANRQRVKSNALLAQEAKRLTEMYQKRKEAGEELPGRIRDRVAAALRVSPTKIGNVTAIENGLKLPALRNLWALGMIPEDAALEIARMDEYAQSTLLDMVTALKKPWTVKTVREFREMLRGSPRPADGKRTRVTVADELHPAPQESVLPRFTDGREIPPRAGEYWCRFEIFDAVDYIHAHWNVARSRWELIGGTEIKAECLGWYPLPKRVEKEDEA